MKIEFLITSAGLMVTSCHSFVTPRFSIQEKKSIGGKNIHQNIELSRKITSRSHLFAENGDSNGQASYDDVCDVLVLGSGPAGSAIASFLGAGGDLDVVMADKNFDVDWVPNYGV